jgi:cyclopropane fatty-acyl-phospholipid synthase-like methyltransferase
LETRHLTFEEYWGYYWRIDSRHAVQGIFDWDRDLVDLIEEQCELKPGAAVLDLGCGGGEYLGWVRMVARRKEPPR